MTPELFKLMADAQQAHWWFRGRRAVLKQLIENAGLAPQPEILELGCGTGSNLPMLSAYGRVTAVELDDFAREYARATTGIDVHPGALPEPLPAFSQPFDLIGMFDVLEHIEAHGPALERVRGLLAPNGRLLVTVPAYQWLYGAHDRLHHHHRRYTAQSLRTLAEGADSEGAEGEPAEALDDAPSPIHRVVTIGAVAAHRRLPDGRWDIALRGLWRPEG